MAAHTGSLQQQGVRDSDRSRPINLTAHQPPAAAQDIWEGVPVRPIRLSHVPTANYRRSTAAPSTGAVVVGDREPGPPGVRGYYHGYGQQQASPYYMYTLTFLSTIGGFLFGYDAGIISGAMLLLVAEFDLTLHQQGLIVSTTLLGCIVAAFGVICLTECFGRRRTIQLNSIVFTVGAGMMAASSGLQTLLAGRFVVGLAIGVASVVVPMYIAEAAPPAQRGTFVALNHVFVAGGHFVACVVAGLFTSADLPHSWRWMFGLAAVPAALQFLGFLFLPESPRWLAKHRGKESARRVLRQLRGRDDVGVELASILASIDENSHTESGACRYCAAVQDAPVRRALTLGCMLQLIQQLTGINTVMYYCGTLFVMAGFTSPAVAIWLTAGVSFVGWLSCWLGVLAVDRLGRRKLTLISLATVVLALLALGAGFFWLERASAVAIKHPSGHSENGTNGAFESRWGSAHACAYHRTCLDCAADSSCGFCSASNSTSGRVAVHGFCVSGNASGPAPGQPLALCESLVDNDAGVAAQTGRTNSLRSSGASVGFTWRVRACFDGAGFEANLGGKIAFAATALYLAAFQPGMGAMPWTLNSEIYPLHARSFGMSVSTITHWVANFLISYTFLPWIDLVGAPFAFWSYATCGVLGWGWLVCRLPETRGLGLEEIEEVFTRYADRVAKEYARRDPASLDVHKYVHVR